MSGDRSELKKSLKEDALEVWNKLKEAVSRYGKYGMLALGLTANMSSILTLRRGMRAPFI